MFKVERRIQFYDCDPAGILFYSKIFEICHAAYEIMLEQASSERNYFEDDEIAIPLIHAESNFVKPIKYGMRVITDIHVSEIRPASFSLSYRLEDKEHELLASAKTIHVCVSKTHWQKVELPEEFRALLEKFS